MPAPTLGQVRGTTNNSERTSPPLTPDTIDADSAVAEVSPPPAPVAPPPAAPAPDPTRTALTAAIGDLQALLDKPNDDPGRAVLAAFDQLSGLFSAKTTAAERYRARLKVAGIDEKDAMAVIDAVLDKDYYEEYVYLRGKRATLRTRRYEDNLRLQTALEEGQHLRWRISQDELISRHNLAASLVEWKGVALPHGTDAQYEVALARIPTMGVPLVNLLFEQLNRFDQKILTIFSEGCTDIFSDPVG